MMEVLSPDHASRLVVMSSYLYYRLNVNPITDHEFDDLCKYCVKAWNELPPIRQWQLGTRKEILASGYRVKVTPMAEAGAWSWARSLNLSIGEGVGPIIKWKHHEEFGRWNYPAGL